MKLIIRQAYIHFVTIDTYRYLFRNNGGYCLQNAIILPIRNTITFISLISILKVTVKGLVSRFWKMFFYSEVAIIR